MSRLIVSADARDAVETESSKPSPKQDEGTVCVRWVRCGRPWCRCMHGGPKHGPYYARYWWHNGRRYKRYIRQQDVVAAKASCNQRHARERDERAQAETAHRAWREVRELLRGIEHDEH